MKILEPTFAASVICANPINIQADIHTLYTMGHRYLHMDIMDGWYVPRLGLYPEISKAISREFPEMKQDVHLMVDDPEFAIDEFSDIDAIEAFVFHIDGHEKDSSRIVDKIHDLGKTAGIALNLGSSFDSTIRLIKNQKVDFVLFMGIHPGVLKQKSQPIALAQNIKDFKVACKKAGCDPDKLTIQVDGGVSFETIPMLIDAGATFFVGGTSTIYKCGETVYNNSNRIKGLMNV